MHRLWLPKLAFAQFNSCLSGVHAALRRPNHQLQTLSHWMSLDSRAKSQLHCSTVRHQMTSCTNPSVYRYTDTHTRTFSLSSTMIRVNWEKENSVALSLSFSVYPQESCEVQHVVSDSCLPHMISKPLKVLKKKRKTKKQTGKQLHLTTVNIHLEVKHKSWPGYFLNISQTRIVG